MLFILFTLFAFALCGRNRPSFPNYTVSVMVDLGDDGTLAQIYGPGLNIESLAVNPTNDKLIVTRYFGGGTFEVDSDAHVQLKQLFNSSVINGELTGIAINRDGDRYVALHSKNTDGTKSIWNGVWRINAGASQCASLNGGGCVKLFPLHNEYLLWADGIAITRRHGKDIIFASDPPLGNIWQIVDNGAASTATIFTGTDAGSVPNFIKGSGVLFPNGSEFNPVGRGFGANGLAFDEYNQILYCINGENAAVVSIKYKNDETAATQKLVGSNFMFKYIYDGVWVSANKLYATVIAELIMEPSFAIVGGNKILGFDLQKPERDWQIVVEHPLIGTPSNVVTGCGFGDRPHRNCDKLYIADIAGEGLSLYGPNLLVATPLEDD